MNLPNKLTVMRMFMVPVCIAAILIPENWLNADIGAIIALVIFAAASITDAIDGKLARKYNLITDFGKFMDPLADKFLVLGSFLAILYRYEQMKTWLFWAVLVVIFREFAVTSIRLVVSSSSGVVIAANWLGKVKTVTQMSAIIVLLLEPVIYHTIEKSGVDLPDFLSTYPPATVILCALMTVFTVWSGVNYLAAYWGYLDP
ncbi:MAG: CDP-diacylglycerol--glycerol-3-phosphate 3-phosphatidyltransferase, partial [Clostridia bacterium]|nr:CDP-diacylglycerol--glycerol-3-phosphate 3-phosphatidyltransferase [Clostridia bacterium]